MSKHKESGFSAVIVLVVVLAVAVVGLVGYIVWDRQQDSSERQPTTQAETSSAPSQASANTQTEASKPASTAKYLVIKEWNVKLPLSDAISDATYKFVTSGSSSGNALLTKSSYMQSWDCTGVGGSIGRFSGRDDPIFQSEGMPPYDTLIKNSVKIGSYYYYRMSPQSMCGDPNNVDEWAKKSTETNEAFGQAFKNLQSN